MSCRRRTLSAKGMAHEAQTNNAVRKRKMSNVQKGDTLTKCHKRSRSDSKSTLHVLLLPREPEKRSSAPQLTCSAVGEDDKIDPVEKLLSMSSTNEILHMDSDLAPDSPLALDSLDSSPFASSSSAYPSLTLNFDKAINDNLRSYYLRLRKSPMEIHNDHSSFSILNDKPREEEPPKACASASQVPFFRNVNFSSTPSFQKLDDYIFCNDDDENEPSSTDSEHEEMPPTAASQWRLPLQESGKMSFHYRQNSNMNLSLSDVHTEQDPQDIFKFMNKRSVISGRASEMIGTSTFMLKDFFF